MNSGFDVSCDVLGICLSQEELAEMRAAAAAKGAAASNYQPGVASGSQQDAESSVHGGSVGECVDSCVRIVVGCMVRCGQDAYICLVIYGESVFCLV